MENDKNNIEIEKLNWPKYILIDLKCSEQKNKIGKFGGEDCTAKIFKIEIWLPRCGTARGSSSELSLGGAIKLKPCKSFLFTEGSLKVENKIVPNFHPLIELIQPYTLVGTPVRSLVSDPLAVYSSRTVYIYPTL